MLVCLLLKKVCFINAKNPHRDQIFRALTRYSSAIPCIPGNRYDTMAASNHMLNYIRTGKLKLEDNYLPQPEVVENQIRYFIYKTRVHCN